MFWGSDILQACHGQGKVRKAKMLTIFAGCADESNPRKLLVRHFFKSAETAPFLEAGLHLTMHARHVWHVV